MNRLEVNFANPIEKGALAFYKGLVKQDAKIFKRGANSIKSRLAGLGNKSAIVGGKLDQFIPNKTIKRIGRIEAAAAKRSDFLRKGYQTRERLAKTGAYTVGGPGIQGKDWKIITKLRKIEDKMKIH